MDTAAVVHVVRVTMYTSALVTSLLTFIVFSSTYIVTNNAIEKFNSSLVHSQMCFLTAASKNHFLNSLKFISSTQKIYPCSRVYYYDLGKIPNIVDDFLHINNFSCRLKG